MKWDSRDQVINLAHTPASSSCPPGLYRPGEAQGDAQGDLLFTEAERKVHRFLLLLYPYLNLRIPSHLLNQTTATCTQETASQS